MTKPQTSFPLWLLAVGLALASLAFSATPAFACGGTVLCVDKDAPGPSHNGTSWTTAYTYLQDALAAATSGNEIWVAEGVYSPDEGGGQTAGNQAASFFLKSGVAIYGGFEATETQRTQRDWHTQLTVLSGDLAGNDTADGHGVVQNWGNVVGTDNTYQIVTGGYYDWGNGQDVTVNNTAVLDGFTITAGRDLRTGTILQGIGAGLLTYKSNPTLSHLVFSGNQATVGGGVYLWEGSAAIAMTDLTFTGNVATQGGGLYCRSIPLTLDQFLFQNNETRNLTAAVQSGGGMATTCNLTLTNGQFFGNTSGSAGGLSTSGGPVSLSQVTFDSNIATEANSGAGGMVSEAGSPVLTDVTFANNSSNGWGGGYYHQNSSLSLTRVSFIDNINTWGPGGGLATVGASVTITNALFAGNRAASGPGGGLIMQANSLTMTNAAFQGNSGVPGGGLALEGVTATLRNVTVSGNQAYEGGGINLRDGSSLDVSNSIIYGNYGGEIKSNSSVVNAAYSIVGGGCPGGATCDQVSTADPLFVLPVVQSAVPTSTGSLRLRATSPAIDAGNNSAVPAGLTTDLNGNPRLVDTPTVTDTGAGTAPIVDMGAYEYNGILPDLTVSQANNVGGTLALGDSFTWTLTVQNTDSVTASFASGNEILHDSLPASGAAYGAPVVQNASGLTGTVACAIDTGSVLSCTASGAVSLAGTSGAFDVAIPVTSSAVGTLTNASCSVDPGNVVAEGREDDNTCSSDAVTVTRATPTLTYQIHNLAHTVVTSAPVGLQIHGWGQVSGLTGFATPTGQASLGLYDNAACSGTAQATYNTTLTGGTAESTSIAAQTFYFHVTYAGDGIYQPVTSGCVLFQTTAATQQPGPTFTVNTLLDDTLDSMCSDGHCTLREAINAANADTIFRIKTILFAVGENQTLTLASALPAITVTEAYGSVTINGETHALTIDGNHAVRVFTVNPGAQFRLQFLTVANGHSSTNGGGLYTKAARVTLDHCAFVGNSAGGYGGAVYSDGDGTLNLSDSIYMEVWNCTFAGNTASNGGGGLANGNQAETYAVHDTFSGGGIKNLAGYLDVYDTIVTTGGSADTCSGDLAGAYDMASSDSGCGSPFTLSSSILLAPLANYGGSTPTFALLPGSAAIDACNPTSNYGTDQRDFLRGPGTDDIGAFESYGFTLGSPTGTPQEALIGTAFATPLGLTVTAKQAGEPVNGGVVTFTAPGSGASASFTSSPATISGGAVSVMATANSTAGPYDVTAATNYSNSVTFSLTNKISNATVELTGLAQTYDGTQKAVTATTDPSGLTVDVTYDGSSTPPVNAGSYAVVATVNQTGYTGTASGTLVIAQREITITAAADSKIYDRTVASSVAPSITSGSLASKDSATWTQVFDTAIVGSGKTLTPAGTVSDGNGGDNYDVTFTPVTTGEITTRPITVTAVTDSKVYDGTTASAGIPTITSGSLATGDSAAWSQTFDTADVGVDKTLTPAGSVSDGNNGNNYAVTSWEAGGGQITARPISVAADAKTKVYGASDPALTYRVTEGTFVGQDALSGALTRATGEDVGTHAIQQGTLTAGTNYDLAYTGADLTITRHDLTVRANDATIRFGEALPAFTVSYAGFITGEDESDLGGTLSFDTSASAASPVGDYPVTPKELTSGNYAIAFVSGTLHITSGSLDLSLAMSASKSNLLSGLDLTYALTAANPGPGTATGVQISDPLPVGVSFISASSSCTESSRTVTCDLGSLAAGDSADVTIAVNVGVSVTGQLANTAVLTASQADPELSNNTAAAVVQVARSKTIYANNFEGGVGDSWCSDVSVSATPLSARHFLGEFGNQEACLSLDGIEEHEKVVVSFDLFVIRSWDGNDAAIGPDEWFLRAGDGSGDPADVLHTSFTNWDFDAQAYPGSYPSSSQPAHRGASEVNTLGYQYAGIAQDAVYYVTLTFDHTAARLVLGFLAQGLQDLADESWGVDNLTVVITGGADLAPNRLYLPAVNR